MRDYIGRTLAAEREAKKTHMSLDHANGIPWLTSLAIIGARGIGKTYAIVQEMLKDRQRYGAENTKIFYLRISEKSKQKMLANEAALAFDKKLLRKFDLWPVSRQGSVLFDKNGEKIAEFQALVSTAKESKGVAQYDGDFIDKAPPGTRRIIRIFLDEFQVDPNIEKATVGDAVSQFRVFLENALRDQQRHDYPAVKIYMAANALGEGSEFLASLFGFVPRSFGKYKLKRKHAMLLYSPPTEAWKANKKRSYTGDLIDLEKDQNYSARGVDLSDLLTKRRLFKPTEKIIFSGAAFTVWDGRVIKNDTGQQLSKSRHTAMQRHIPGEVYDMAAVNRVFELYDESFYLFADVKSCADFRHNMRKLKK